MEPVADEPVGKDETQRCLTPGCESPRVCRGVCQRCYHEYTRQVRKRLVTWEMLELCGRVLTPYSGRGRTAEKSQ